jgi:hypothetical protein
MDYKDRLAVKLLAQASALLSRAVNETLCQEPDRRVIRAMIRDAAEMVAEFEDTYFEDEAAG